MAAKEARARIKINRLLEDAGWRFFANDAGPAKAYAAGDTIKIPVIAAAPLELAGGQDGDDTLTWTVRGSAGGAWPDYTNAGDTQP